MVAGDGSPCTPGHAVPAGVELLHQESVEAWLGSMGYADKKTGDADSDTYAEVMIDAGHDDMYKLNFTEEELVFMGVKRPHARQLVVASQAVGRTLGTVGAVVSGGGGGGSSRLQVGGGAVGVGWCWGSGWSKKCFACEARGGANWCGGQGVWYRRVADEVDLHTLGGHTGGMVQGGTLW